MSFSRVAWKIAYSVDLSDTNIWRLDFNRPGRELPKATQVAASTHEEAEPRLSPDGAWLAWLEWDHPDMPWDSTTLYIADLADGALANVTPIAGGPREFALSAVREPRRLTTRWRYVTNS